MGKTFKDKSEKVERRERTGMDGILLGMLRSNKITKKMRDRRERRPKDARRQFHMEDW